MVVEAVTVVEQIRGQLIQLKSCYPVELMSEFCDFSDE
jgi:hypothetical protein